MAVWFRSWHGAPTDNKWLVVARRADTTPGVVSAIFWALLDCASQSDDRGSISEFDTETYAEFSGFGDDVITRVLRVMGEKNVIIDNRLANWDKRQPKREDDSTPRVRRHRAGKSVTENSNAMKRTVTHGNNTEVDIEVEKIRTEKNNNIPHSADNSPAKAKPVLDANSQAAMFGALADVCILDGKIKAKQIGQTAKTLIGAGYTADQVLAFDVWWHKVDWRGQKGAAPTLAQVAELIKQSLAYTNGHGAAASNADPGGWDALGKEQERTVNSNAHKFADTEIPF